MSRTITHLYDSYDEAARAVRMLEDAGVAHADISIVGADPDRRPYAGTEADPNLTTAGPMTTPVDYDRAAAGDLASPAPVAATPLAGEETHGAATGAGAGASLGTLLGGGAGLLAGIGALAIPGVGPVVAAGWLVATLTGAGAGAAAGGLLGALGGSSGAPHEHTHVYAEGLRRGGTLVSVRAADADAGRIEALLEGTGRVDVARRASEYRAGGWSGFDPDASPAGAVPTDPATGAMGGSTMAGSTMGAGLDPASVEADRARAGTHV